ncbi:hypothetical protein DXG01_007286 [Tephrocybe rancida]|nr:hypothetical protein DXG01_007286 [Tephrocybe rancida]
MLVCHTIKNHVKRIKESNHHDLGSLDRHELTEDDVKDSKNATSFGNIQLGAPQTRVSLEELQFTHLNDVAFRNFRGRLEAALDELLRQKDSPVKLSRGSKLTIKPNSYLKEYRFIKASYESLVDWRAYTDYLRCNPMFYNRPRYDCVIVHSMDGDYFARLLFVFTYVVEADDKDTPIPMALVQPFTTIKQENFTKKDIDLGLLRLEETLRAESIFIPARSIVHGVYLVPDNEKETGWSVLDTLDSDMFLRMHIMYPPSNT